MIFHANCSRLAEGSCTFFNSLVSCQLQHTSIHWPARQCLASAALTALAATSSRKVHWMAASIENVCSKRGFCGVWSPITYWEIQALAKKNSVIMDWLFPSQELSRWTHSNKAYHGTMRPSYEILPKRRFTSFKLALTASSSWTSEASDGSEANQSLHTGKIQEVSSKMF